MGGVKTCGTCKTEKSLSEFYKDPRKAGRYVYQCKSCRAIYSRGHQGEYYRKNKKHILARQRRYKKTPSGRATQAKYSRNRLAKDLQFKLAHYIRKRISDAIRRNRKAGSAVRDLGCSIIELKVYLENLFQENMTWDNWGEWHMDHIIPLSAFDLTDKEQFIKACHYTNLQPLWKADNLNKGSKII